MRSGSQVKGADTSARNSLKKKGGVKKEKRKKKAFDAMQSPNGKKKRSNCCED